MNVFLTAGQEGVNFELNRGYMTGTKIKIDKALMVKIKKFSRTAGYSSPEEFVVHVLEKEISKFEESEDDEVLKERLKGLGYLA